MPEFITSARPDEMIGQEPAAIAALTRERCPQTACAWGLWALLGVFGAHLLYLRRPREALMRPVALLGGALAALRWPAARPAIVILLVAGWLVDGMWLRRLLAAARDAAEREAIREVETERDAEWRV
jgi:hypothetical protein